MAALIGTSFTGVQDMSAVPGKPIVNTQVENVAKDHGYAYELLTNKKGDGTNAAPTTTGHNHSEAGNRLMWPVSTFNFGPENPADYASQTPPFIEAQSPTAASNLVLFMWPVFVPAGMVGLDLLVVMESYGVQPPAIAARLSTWGTTSPPSAAAYTTETIVTNMERVPFTKSADIYSAMFDKADGTFWMARLTPATTGLHTITIVRDINATLEVPVYFRGGGVYWGTYYAGENMPKVQTKPTQRAAGTVVVGDPHASNAWMAVDSTLAVADFAMGPAIMMNQVNSAWLEESATGLAAAGNTSLTVAGHEHSNPGSAPWLGRGLEFTTYSEPYGTIEHIAGSTATSTTNAIKGRFRAPWVADTTTSFVKVRSFTVYTPPESGSAALYACAVVYTENGKAARMEVKVTSTPSGGGGNSVTLQSASGSGGGPRLEILTGSTALNTQSAGSTKFDVEARLDTGGTGESSSTVPAALLGLCLFWDR